MLVGGSGWLLASPTEPDERCAAVSGVSAARAAPRAALDAHPCVAMQILWQRKIAGTMKIYTEIPSAATRDTLRKLVDWLDQ